MMRRWRPVALVLTVTALMVGPAAYASDAGSDRGDVPTDRVGDRVVDVAPEAVTDSMPDPTVDVAADVPSGTTTDRAVDTTPIVVTDRPSDRITDREQRPSCDRDRETDRVNDCRTGDSEIRPALARCMAYVQSHIDGVVRRNSRWLWHVCHRIAWNDNNSE
jgi:hypothetical protein